MIERQRLYIGSMRASRFWRIRDAVFGVLRRLGIRPDPLPVETASERAITDAALGDAYQLFHLRHRRSEADAAWLRGLAPLLAVADPIALVLDARGALEAACDVSLAALLAQIYPHWQVGVWFEPDDAAVCAWASSVASRDERIRPGAWSPASGETAVAIGAIAAGDVLEPEALLLVAIELHRGADLVYTDEDRLRGDGTCDEPRFKPDWSPETALTRDYVGRLCVVRSAMLAVAGGLDPSAATALWYDALLRVSEHTGRIVHVPRVVCHRSASSHAVNADDLARAVRAALDRRGEDASVRPADDGVAITFSVSPDERVAVIVPTRDHAELLETCVSSVFEQTTHRAFELIVVDNGSVEPAMRALFDRWTEREPQRFRVIRDEGPFNFSRLNNLAVRSTRAPFVTLLNNDTEVISRDWMTAMLGQARRSPIGAVGALLLYADGTVQHGGVMLGGVLGLAGHAYRNAAPNRDAPPALRFDTNYLAVTGACLMVERRKFEEVGGLDESLAVAFNDVDFCLKLWSAGYRNVFVPQARLFHYESKSRGGDDTRAKQARAFAESEALRRRWPDLAARDPYYNPNLTLTSEDWSVRR